MFATSLVTVAAASAMAVTLGPEPEELAKGVINAGQEVEFSVENATKENVLITNIVLKQTAAPMVLKFVKPVAPECEVKVELAKGAKCNEKVKNTAEKTGGSYQYIIEAAGANKWKTIVNWF
ncbi:MAG TPA: hypothetical protein VMB05_08375 [Solirubrobacteraceae bacterium]|nr:hypothetical protein [Solirubrobacteraceae bacterium]